MEISEWSDRVHGVAGLQRPHVARASAGRAFLTGRRSSDTDIEADRAFARVAGNRVVVPLGLIRIFCHEVEDFVLPPDRGIRLRDIEVAVGDFAVGGNGELQVIAGLVGQRTIHRFHHNLADECRNIGGADDAERAAFLLPRSGPTGIHDIEVNPIIADLDGIRREASADRSAGRRTIREVEASVVFRAFDDAAFHETLGEVVIAVSANTVGRKEPTLRIANEGEGFSTVVKAKDVLLTEIGLGANFHPAVRIRFGITRNKAFDRTFLGSRKDTLHMIGRVFLLAYDRRQNLSPCRKNRRIRRRAIVFDEGMELVE